MAQNVIAIVSDCDGTICPDTATALVQDLGLDADKFWLDVGRDVEDGWDPPLTWLSRLIRASREGAIPPLTRERLRLVGVAVPMYPGVADFLDRIRERIHGRADFREAGIIVEWYIVSSGIEEMLRALNAARIGEGRLRQPPTLRRARQSHRCQGVRHLHGEDEVHFRHQ